MEAAGIPGREADVAPAPAETRAAGSVDPGGSRPAGPRRIRGHDVRAQHDQREPGQRRGASVPCSRWRSHTVASRSCWRGCGSSGPATRSGRWRSRPSARSGSRSTSSMHVSAGDGHRARRSRLYLWMWAIFTTYMFFASLRTTAAVALVFLLLAITFILLAIGDMGSRPAPASRMPAGTSGSPRRSRLGTRRSRRSSTRRSVASCCRSSRCGGCKQEDHPGPKAAR